MGTWKAVVDALVKVYHESPRFMAVMCAICAVLLFLPPHILAMLAVEPLVLRYRPYFGIGFLFFFMMTVSYPVNWCWTWGQKKIREIDYKRAIKQRLAKLDSNEQNALRPYISENRRNRYFYFNDGTVANLRHCCILVIPNTPGTMFDRERVPHVMVDWVWDYLHEHPELLGESGE